MTPECSAEGREGLTPGDTHLCPLTAQAGYLVTDVAAGMSPVPSRALSLPGLGQERVSAPQSQLSTACGVHTKSPLLLALDGDTAPPCLGLESLGPKDPSLAFPSQAPSSPSQES